MTFAGLIRPTPTQMFDGTQLYSGRGDTTVTVSLRPSHLRANAAAVCPAMPAPSTTTRLTQAANRRKCLSQASCRSRETTALRCRRVGPLMNTMPSGTGRSSGKTTGQAAAFPAPCSLNMIWLPASRAVELADGDDVRHLGDEVVLGAPVNTCDRRAGFGCVARAILHDAGGAASFYSIMRSSRRAAGSPV